jgi:Cu-processing system ATP-binding protein
MLNIVEISKKFGQLKALDTVSAQFNAGQAVSLIGPNGSGKTTLIKCILGLVSPNSGQISLQNTSILGQWNYRKMIGYMPQIGRYPDNMRVKQVFQMIQEIHGMATPVDDDLIKALKIDQFGHKPMRTLSGGTRQKVSACLAFMFNPEILILDEPTAGLDPLSAEILKEKILEEKKKGKMILVTSHILSDLDEITTDVLYIMEGTIRFFKPIEQLKTETGELTLNRAIANIMKKHQS